MEAQQHRGRSSSAGNVPHNRIRHSPSPRRFNGQILDPSFHTPDFSSGDYSSNTLSNTESGMQYNVPTYINGNARQLPFQQHVLPSNDFSDPTLGQSYQPDGTSQRRTSQLINETNNHFNPNILESNSPTDFGDFSQQQDFATKQSLPFENAFLLDPQLQANMQAHRQSINPADIMSNMSSPQNMNTTPPNLMPPDGSSPGHGSPSSTQAHTFSPDHSRHASLDPSSAQFPNGQQPTDWAGMLSGAQFQGHRRAPSEHSDVSSSVAPSPYLGQQDSFEAFEPAHSPMLGAQQDPQLYHDALGIETFSLSDPQQQIQQHQQQQQQEHISPRHSPYPSPRMTPHPGFGLPQENNFILSNDMQQNNFNGQPGPEIYTSPPSQSFPQFTMRHDSGDMGQAAQMAPPEINVELAPPSRQPNFEPLRPENDMDALSPPERGRRNNRTRAKSETYISRPMTPTSPSTLSNDGDSTSHRDRNRSLSPFDISFTGYSSSRDASPSAKSRRSSTSAIPNRDYILELADPTRPPVSGERKVQKHPATFQCHLCPKRFTRAYNLRSHLRTHTDERPFVCTVCGKAFARQHDRKRHEGLHSGEKKFVCRGELGTGGSWGCGRRFARADALGRHFRSEAGRICIKPLLDEEAMERQRQFDESMLVAQGGASPMHNPNAGANGGGFTLPAALLAQYPALQGLQWDNMPGDDLEEVSGRSSFDAGSGADSYFEDEDGYVSGPGVGAGAGGWHGGGVGHEWASDYEGGR